MVGFNGILKSEFQSKFTLILAEGKPALYTAEYLSTLISNLSLDTCNFVSLISFIYRNVETLGSFRHYNYSRRAPPELGELFEDLKNDVRSDRRNILILDDLALFSLNIDRCKDKLFNFFKQISKLYNQVLICCTVDTVSKEEISLLCDLAEHVVILKNPGEEQEEFLCHILTLKPSGKTILDQSKLEFKNGSFIETAIRKSEGIGKASGPSDDIMRSLTTFKLTIEESERESKSKLYLPYLDAQRTAVPNPEEDFYDDDDEEDEDD